MNEAVSLSVFTAKPSAILDLTGSWFSQFSDLGGGVSQCTGVSDFTSAWRIVLSSVNGTKARLVTVMDDCRQRSSGVEDMLVTPFAQILQSLRTVRDNYVNISRLLPAAE